MQNKSSSMLWPSCAFRKSSAARFSISSVSAYLHAFSMQASSRRAGRSILLQSDALVNEQPALAADAAAIPGETSIGADDPVARNHNGHRVCAIGQADRTDGFRAAQLSRQRPITERRTGSDRSECRPHLALKRG